jgi:hypothetical protein
MQKVVSPCLPGGQGHVHMFGWAAEEFVVALLLFVAEAAETEEGRR